MKTNVAACPLPSGLPTVDPHPATRFLELLLFTLQQAEALLRGSAISLLCRLSDWSHLAFVRDCTASHFSWAKTEACCALGIFDVLVATSPRFKNKQKLS